MEEVGLSEIRQRLARIQLALDSAIISSLEFRLLKIVEVIGSLTSGYTTALYGTAPTVYAERVDKLVRNCGFMQQILAEASMLKSYSTRNVQIWTSTQSMIGQKRPLHPSRPQQIFFKSVNRPLGRPVKPTDEGFYTSSLLPVMSTSMWVIYLDYYGGTLFPKPWHHYEMNVKSSARVYDVTDARAWVSLIKRFSVQQGNLIYPDWRQIARFYDGVHISLPAVIAMQGLRLSLGGMQIAEAYWDVETTFWLSWQFH